MQKRERQASVGISRQEFAGSFIKPTGYERLRD